MMTATGIESGPRVGMTPGFLRFVEKGGAPLNVPARMSHPAADILVDPGYITVRADLPGIPAENVEVTVTSRLVEVVGWPPDVPKTATYHIRERPGGILRRTISLPEEVVAQRSQASLGGGVVEIRIPRRPITSGWTGRMKEAWHGR